MPLVVFNRDGTWADLPGMPRVTYKKNVPIEVNDRIAGRAISTGRAELAKPKKAKPKKKPLPSPVIEADEEKAGPVVKAEKAPPKRTRKRKK